ncbi:discoidin domain-containing protein [Microscilla marina]|uniref:F5/8 type C domain protein n=1 Tax=Microscilla marina ATCC 23134 TaxID=313606 RepID=A1ZUG1_MICM2|nr:discoidin domain-containing protein [Microscilla marina]EAY25980.1 F5/8 type C domain protein [Microscilla marina ATCC 23134]
MTLRVLIVLCLFISPHLFSQKLPLINALALRNGAHVVTTNQSLGQANSPRVPAGTPEALIDEDLKNGWTSPLGAPRLKSFVFELSDAFLLKQIGFNNEQATPQQRNRSVKKIRIEFSNEAHNRGFHIEYTLILEANSPIRLMGIQNVKARWIRITILSNYGHPRFTRFNEIQAWGVHANTSPAVDLTGTWQTPKGPMSLLQKGRKVTGCYPQNKGSVVNGMIKGRQLSFDWSEAGTQKFGKATLVINQTQNRLYGIWSEGQLANPYGHWVFIKKSDTATNCSDRQREGQAQIKKE